jgi:hypothetical protein
MVPHVSGPASKSLDGQQRKVISTDNLYQSGLVSKLSHGKQRTIISTNNIKPQFKFPETTASQHIVLTCGFLVLHHFGGKKKKSMFKGLQHGDIVRGTGMLRMLDAVRYSKLIIIGTRNSENVIALYKMSNLRINTSFLNCYISSLHSAAILG